jgi:hypothetical protein
MAVRFSGPILSSQYLEFLQDLRNVGKIFRGWQQNASFQYPELWDYVDLRGNEIETSQRFHGFSCDRCFPVPRSGGAAFPFQDIQSCNINIKRDYLLRIFKSGSEEVTQNAR